jgi:thiosulfate/3-mercaptopyruvate sulfurtransferase
MDVTRDELAARLDDPSLTILDVRTPAEFAGELVAPCDPRAGHIPGARNVDVAELMGMATEEIHDRLDLPPGSEIVAYCHSGGRSAIACSLLRAAGYESRNYVGSWHEWSRDPTLPIEPASESESESESKSESKSESET